MREDHLDAFDRHRLCLGLHAPLGRGQGAGRWRCPHMCSNSAEHFC